MKSEISEISIGERNGRIGDKIRKDRPRHIQWRPISSAIKGGNPSDPNPMSACFVIDGC